MTKSYCINFFIGFLLTACTGSIRTDAVDFTQGFTDGNSKVWMVNKVLSPDGAYTMPEKLKKEVLVFYQSGGCFLTNLQKLSKGQGRKGRFALDHEKQQVTLYFLGETREFAFEFADENNLMLYPLEGSQYTNAMELIPFPELTEH